MGCPYSANQMFQNYPRGDAISRDQLFKSLGWDDLIDNDAYRNTCAIRMSVCLLRCGMNLPEGELIVLEGHLKDRRVMIRFDGLAKYLKRQWGAPTVFRKVKEDDLKGKQGVIAFFDLPCGYPGHIDVIKKEVKPVMFLWFRLWDEPTIVCGTHCHFGSKEAWFWPAP